VGRVKGLGKKAEGMCLLLCRKGEATERGAKAAPGAGAKAKKAPRHR
jgi:hypothetical protein